MVWYREFGRTEWIFIATFLILYLMYVLRVIRIAKLLKTPFYTIVIKLVLRSLFFSLLIISLLGPSFGESKKEVKSIGKDIMICVDLSKSMDAFDIQPTRLEKIKYELKKIVTAFNSDRVGVIIFSAEAFMQCPLTFDQNALNLFIESMNTGLVPTSGTDFAPPLKMAIQKLESDDNKGAAQAKSKVIVLISDGEDFGESTNKVLQDIEKKGIKLFTLGIGTEQGGKIHTSSGYKKDASGRDVVTKLNPRPLRTLASKTNGEYFEINATHNGVSKLINTINNIEGELRDVRFVDVTANKYFYFLALAVILFVIDMLVNIKTLSL